MATRTTSPVYVVFVHVLMLSRNLSGMLIPISHSAHITEFRSQWSPRWPVTMQQLVCQVAPGWRSRCWGGGRQSADIAKGPSSSWEDEELLRSPHCYVTVSWSSRDCMLSVCFVRRL